MTSASCCRFQAEIGPCHASAPPRAVWGQLVAHVDARPQRVSHQLCCASDVLACLGRPLPLAIPADGGVPETRGSAKAGHDLLGSGAHEEKRQQ